MMDGNGHDRIDPELTVLYEPDRFHDMPRWAPWEWMVYEFEHGLASPNAPRPQVYPKPKL